MCWLLVMNYNLGNNFQLNNLSQFVSSQWGALILYDISKPCTTYNFEWGYPFCNFWKNSNVRHKRHSSKAYPSVACQVWTDVCHCFLPEREDKSERFFLCVCCWHLFVVHLSSAAFHVWKEAPPSFIFVKIMICSLSFSYISHTKQNLGIGSMYLTFIISSCTWNQRLLFHVIL